MTRPLVLLLAARRAERHPRLAVAQREARRQRRARPLARCKAVRQARARPEHLPARAHRKAEFRDHRRGLQPAGRGRGADHVAAAVDDVDMAGVAADRRRGAPPSARPRRRRRRSAARPATRRHDRRMDRSPGRCRAAAPATRCPPISARRAVVVVVRQQNIQRHSGKIRIAVIRLAIGVGEFRRLRHRMHELARRAGPCAPISKPFSSASCCRNTGPWLHGPHFSTVWPW